MNYERNLTQKAAGEVGFLGDQKYVAVPIFHFPSLIPCPSPVSNTERPQKITAKALGGIAT
jgi:hypothetical protein